MPDIHGAFDPTDEELEAMRPRIRAFIFPSVPRLDFEQEAFEQAVEYQVIHEKTIAAAVGMDAVPDNVKSFGIGDFNMTFGDGSSNGTLTRKTICQTAYGILLEAGLMYKGVEGR